MIFFVTESPIGLSLSLQSARVLRHGIINLLPVFFILPSFLFYLIQVVQEKSRRSGRRHRRKKTAQHPGIQDTALFNIFSYMHAAACSKSRESFPMYMAGLCI